MKRLFSSSFFLLVAIPLCAQLSSTDIKDASTTGPFPLYIGLGFANSFRNQDLIDVGRHFNAFSNGNERIKTRLYGLQLMAGSSIIPANSNISYVVEARFLWLKRPMEAAGNEFYNERSQLSLGGGARVAFFPFVFQMQVGAILRHFSYYSFDVDGHVRTVKFDTNFGGLTSLARLSILDPAGTEGGLGVYVEAGYNFTGFNRHNRQLSSAIRVYDPSHQGNLDSKYRYGYLSFGVLLPIAIRIN